MSVRYDQRNRRWRFEFKKTVNGNRIRFSKLLPKTWTRTQAQAFDQTETARIYASATGAIKQQSLIDEAVVNYCRNRCPKLKEGIEIEKDLARMHGYYEGRYVSELADVTREFEEAERDRLSPARIRNLLSYLRSACKYSHKYHNTDEVPDILLPIVRNERKEYITRTEMIRVARATRNRHARAMVRIAFYSGMRLGEILDLGKESKILDDGFLLINTKNGEDRFVPMHPALKPILKYLPIPWSEKWMQQCVRNAMDFVGLNHIRFHDLRHSTASNLINAGADLYTVGVVLGHKDMRSTARYSHLAKKTLNDVIRKIK